MVQFPASEVEGFRTQLEEMQHSLVDGKFITDDKSAPEGQAVVVGLLNRCLVWADLCLSRYDVNVQLPSSPC